MQPYTDQNNSKPFSTSRALTTIEAFDKAGKRQFRAQIEENYFNPIKLVSFDGTCYQRLDAGDTGYRGEIVPFYEIDIKFLSLDQLDGDPKDIEQQSANKRLDGALASAERFKREVIRREGKSFLIEISLDDARRLVPFSPTPMAFSLFCEDLLERVKDAFLNTPIGDAFVFFSPIVRVSEIDEPLALRSTGSDEPWSLADCVKTLVSAAKHLLDSHACDKDHERTLYATRRGEQYLKDAGFAVEEKKDDQKK